MKKVSSLILGYIKDRLNKRSTYMLPLVVGTVINCYGQLLIPYLRGVEDPLIMLTAQMDTTPGLLSFSIFLGYFFPFLVSLYSAVMTRLGSREIELKAQLPDHKPDPVFCVNQQGKLITCGKTTQTLFNAIGFTDAGDFLGQTMWRNILDDLNGVTSQPFSTLFYCKAAKMSFQTRYVKNAEGSINIYLSEHNETADQ
jgi:hypothetical protein